MAPRHARANMSLYTESAKDVRACATANDLYCVLVVWVYVLGVDVGRVTRRVGDPANGAYGLRGVIDGNGVVGEEVLDYGSAQVIHHDGARGRFPVSGCC